MVGSIKIMCLKAKTNNRDFDLNMKLHLEFKITNSNCQSPITSQGFDDQDFESCDLSLDGPEKFAPGKPKQVSNLMIAKLFYPHILNMKRGCPHTRSFSSRGAFEERAPGFESKTA